MADSLGVSNKNVSKWECDEGLPDIMILPLLAETLEVSIEEILSGKRLNIAATGENKTSAARMNLICKKAKMKFNNISILCLGLSILSLIFTLLLITFTSVVTQAFWIIGFIVMISALILQGINHNVFRSAVDINELSDVNEEQKRHHKLTTNRILFNWSYSVFSTIILNACICILMWIPYFFSDIYVLILFIYLFSAILVNGKYIIRKLLIRNHTINKITNFRPWKLNLIFSVVAITILAVILICALITDNVEMVVWLMFGAIAMQIIYMIIRVSLDKKHKIPNTTL